MLGEFQKLQSLSGVNDTYQEETSNTGKGDRTIHWSDSPCPTLRTHAAPPPRTGRSLGVADRKRNYGFQATCITITLETLVFLISTEFEHLGSMRLCPTLLEPASTISRKKTAKTLKRSIRILSIIHNRLYSHSVPEIHRFVIGQVGIPPHLIPRKSSPSQKNPPI